jgi:molybdenum cofactor synthesis domain-containing protein
MARTAAALVIGNEVLSGKIQDTNSHDLARMLRSVGVELRRIVTVPDERAVIAQALNELRAVVDVVITSGGIGPTHDDVTIESVAQALGRRTVRDPTLEAALRAYYQDRCTEAHLRMASIVEGTTLLRGEDGRAPWPAMQVDNVFLLPGIPQLFRAQLALIRPAVANSERVFAYACVICRGDEPSLKRDIDAVVSAFDDVSVGSYPRWHAEGTSEGLDRFSVKVTFDGEQRERVEAAARAFAARLDPARLVRIDFGGP